MVIAEDNAAKRVSITDNGTGMPASMMNLLCNSVGAHGSEFWARYRRYGMGLPNGSLSQARRVDVFSWTNPHAIWSSYLDVDEIALRL